MKPGIKSPELFTTHNVARLMGVDYTTVITWCEKGKLSSIKTPGGHRRIALADLFSFLKAHNFPIPPELKNRYRLQCVIVDDETSIRKMVRRALLQIEPNAKIEEAADGFGAGQKIMEVLPRVVVLDLNLPGMDGFSVCRRIRQESHLRTTKILAISGQSTKENKKKIIQAGADDFLAKPFDPKSLKDALRRLLP